MTGSGIGDNGAAVTAAASGTTRGGAGASATGAAAAGAADTATAAAGAVAAGAGAYEPFEATTGAIPRSKSSHTSSTSLRPTGFWPAAKPPSSALSQITLMMRG